MDAALINDGTLDELPNPSQVGKTPVGGIDVNKPRTRAVLTAAPALACSPDGFTARQFAATVQSVGSPYRSPRRCAPSRVRPEKIACQEPVDQSGRFPTIRDSTTSYPHHRSAGDPSGKSHVPFWPELANLRWAVNQKTGVRSMNTMKLFARTCLFFFKTCVLQRSNRQNLVDVFL